MPHRRTAALCGVTLGLSGCGGDDVTELSLPVLELSLATFNAAIGVGLAPHAEQRLDAIERDLPSLAADVICLQELWRPEDIERIAQTLGGEFPYSHSSARERGASVGGAAGPACTESEAGLLVACLSESCSDVDEASLPFCAIANCAEPFTQVSSACQQCIAANQTAEDVQNLVDICAADDGAAAAYEDQTGLLLLSRHPLTAPDFLELESSLGDRGVLSARVMTQFAGPVDMYCTHLAASLNDIPYTGPYGSWQQERVRQIEQFLEWVSETRAPGGAAALLGDMNCGPATELARSASPDAFELFVTGGFDAPYADEDGRCTFCSSNPLNGFVTDADEGALIDHVLLSGFGSSAVAAASRVFDEAIEIQAGSERIETMRSDHYGVQVMLSGAGPGQ